MYERCFLHVPEHVSHKSARNVPAQTGFCDTDFLLVQEMFLHVSDKFFLQSARRIPAIPVLCRKFSHAEVQCLLYAGKIPTPGKYNLHSAGKIPAPVSW